jgi:hypothetical protein
MPKRFPYTFPIFWRTISGIGPLDFRGLARLIQRVKTQTTLVTTCPMDGFPLKAGVRDAWCPFCGWPFSDEV